MGLEAVLPGPQNALYVMLTLINNTKQKQMLLLMLAGGS